ncbi:MAG: ribosome biogenesis GTP-binding protein YihA/YsxC [Verrucomicrobiota bacterium]
MKIHSASLLTSAPDLEVCPEPSKPEFAFVGRSNVGKSSLINMLTGNDGLARTSSQPGKTRLINFFTINDHWRLVDLPGYGYAKVSKADRQDFNERVSEYLLERQNLKHIFVLVDSQHEPMDSDLSFLEWLQEMELPFSVIFTKTDRASKSQVGNNVAFFLEECQHLAIHPAKSFPCSAKTAAGKRCILEFIDSFLSSSGKRKNGSKKKPQINLDWMNKGKK